MRINVYSQELILDNVALAQYEDENGMPTIEFVTQESNTGLVYSAARLFLRSLEQLHHTPEDDDRSAITFWLPKSTDKREIFAKQLELLAEVVRNAPRETGLD